MSEWIKCSEKVPEEKTPVLVCCAGRPIPVVGYYINGYWRVCSTEAYLPATGWMALPELPEWIIPF